MITINADQLSNLNIKTLESFSQRAVVDLMAESPELFHGLDEDARSDVLDAALEQANMLAITSARDLRVFIRLCFLVGPGFATIAPFDRLLAREARDGPGIGQVFDAREQDWRRAAVIDAVARSGGGGCCGPKRAKRIEAVSVAPAAPGHAPDIWRHSAHPDVWRMGDAIPDPDVMATRARIVRQHEDPDRKGFVILDAAAALLGGIDLRIGKDGCEASYWVRRDYWGRGVARLALSRLIQDWPGGATALSARISVWNLPSQRVALACGFKEIAADGDARLFRRAADEGGRRHGT